MPFPMLAVFFLTVSGVAYPLRALLYDEPTASVDAAVNPIYT